ncbi:hypothetical protein [Noviherbaspirillum saxi]|nr:hypothetical protein [Noviherbaspirillum saxi]
MQRWSLIEPAFFTKSAQYDELVRLELVKTESTLTSEVTEALIARYSDQIRMRDLDKARFLAHQTIVALLRAMALVKPEYLKQEDTPLLLGRMLYALLTTEA